MKSIHCFFVACVLLMTAPLGWSQEVATAHEGQVRTHYIAVDEVEWDYAPSGIDQMTGMSFDHMSQLWTEQASNRIGKLYRKAVYHEYADVNFTTLKKRPPEWDHLGLLGPVLRAEVGDTFRVVFKNNGTHDYSMHPHGVFYEKSSEGAHYNDGERDFHPQWNRPSRRRAYLRLGSAGARRTRTEQSQFDALALSLPRVRT
jgi:FtsP/CotA-like multicopper oxidase with cupredoxin domain